MPKMTNSPAYLWYPRDVFDSERVEDLSPAEECWYRRALDRSWGDEGISADPVKAAKRIGKKCTVKAAEMILKVFFVPKKNDPTKMVNPRQEKERKKLFEKSKQRSAAGKKGMAKRWKQKSKSDNAVITPLDVCNNISSSISITSKEEENAPGKPPLREIFLGKVEAALASRMGIKTLPNRHDWHQRLLWAFTNDFTPEAVIETYDLMKKGFWANKSVSAKSLVDNIPNLEALRAEVASKNGHRPVDDLPDGEMLYAK